MRSAAKGTVGNHNEKPPDKDDNGIQSLSEEEDPEIMFPRAQSVMDLPGSPSSSPPLSPASPGELDYDVVLDMV